jgi:hypothetical protein
MENQEIREKSWHAGFRVGCAAVYPASEIDFSEGLHPKDHGRDIICWHIGEPTEKVIRRFRLIAAAPDLLRELENLITLAEIAMRDANKDLGEYDIREELRDARSVVARAKSTKPLW